MKKIAIALILISLISCHSYKKQMFAHGGKDEARINVMRDFINRYNKAKKQKAFEIWEEYENNDSLFVFCIRIHKNHHKFKQFDFPEGEHTTAFPSRYYIMDDVLFYWSDTTRAVSREVFNVMKKYDAVEITNDIIVPEPDYKNSYWYLICKNNLKKYKVIKKIWIKENEFPQLNFKCKNKI